MERTELQHRANSTDLAELLERQVAQRPRDTAYVFLEDGEREAGRLTYSELDQRARGVARRLLQTARPGDRALLMYPNGIEFLVAFFGCLYAGVTAVPAYLPQLERRRRSQRFQRLVSILEDAEPTLALTTREVVDNRDSLAEQAPAFAVPTWIATEELPGEEAGGALVDEAYGWDRIAYLQYTSGSTSSPKGVMVSHGNLMTNFLELTYGVDMREGDAMVTWLPAFHDMGLIFGMLLPLFNGIPCYLMKPEDFVQQPVRWLQALARYRGTHAAAPNFALDLCVDRVDEAELRTLDLSAWRVLLNGAEPLKMSSIERFTRRFSACGFPPNGVVPGYGLAEATLGVSIRHPEEPLTVVPLDPEALEQGRLVEEGKGHYQLVGCGWTRIGTRIRVVDPNSHQPCPPDTVGEIWLGGETVAHGYWQRPEQTREKFEARVQDAHDQASYLRTGDLGFVRHGALFITGRADDLIIVHGRNLYPQDLEISAESSHEALRAGRSAAFAVERDGEPRVGLVMELTQEALRQRDDAAILRAVRAAVADQHQVDLEALALIPPGAIPVTSSGKIQRQQCRRDYLEGRLDSASIGCSKAGSSDQKASARSEPARPDQASSERVEAWFRDRLAREMETVSEQVDVTVPLRELGLGSTRLVTLLGELEAVVATRLPPSLLFDYPSVRELADYIGGVSAERSAPSGAAPAEARSDAVAVVGVACRLPGAETPDELWQRLSRGEECLREVPAERWDTERYYHPDPETPGTSNVRRAGFLDDVEGFDAAFFGISPREAASMDPHQRLALELAWAALEDAGKAGPGLAGSRTGVYAGVSAWDFSVMAYERADAVGAYSATGSAHSIVANRISYLLDLTGPSMAVDTACSSSLVAIHNACQALRLGECDSALVGGVNLMLTPEMFAGLSDAHMLASDGQSKTFDAGADGYGRGEGGGFVVLRRLEDALADGDRVLAVVKGSAVNQDGRSNGLTAPSGRAQQAAVRSALTMAGLAPSAPDYIETHGTGTPLGDPVEVDALGAVIGERSTPCRLGSIKANLGHLEAAAGIAGFIKALLMLKHNAVPPQPAVNTLNPHLNLGNSLTIPSRLEPLSGDGGPGVVGVSSFGFGGTNAHVVLASAPAVNAAPTGEDDECDQLLTLSARTPEALRAQAGQVAAALRQNSGLRLADLCYSANAGRAALEQRLSVVADSSESLAEKLSAFAEEASKAVRHDTCKGKRPPRVVFLFSGQSSQFPGMARGLYRRYAVFREAFERCAALASPYLDQPLAEVVLNPDEAERLQETAYTQLGLVAVEYALAALWRDWGVEPSAVAGHSLGEYVAACVAGALSVEAMIALVAERSRLVQGLAEKGAMASVGAEPGALEAVLAAHSGRLTIAAYNAPRSTVLSGAEDAVADALARLEEQDVPARPLRVAAAFHSPLMDPLLADFEAFASGIEFQAPRIPLVCQHKGRLLGAGEVPDAAYWRRHLREPVRFADGVTALQEQGGDTWIELGPGQTLLGLMFQNGGDAGLGLASLAADEPDDTRVPLESLGALFRLGQPIDWRAVHRSEDARLVSLPSYPFQHQHFPLPKRAADSQRQLQDSATGDATHEHGESTTMADKQMEVLMAQSRALEAQANALRDALAGTQGGVTPAGQTQAPVASDSNPASDAPDGSATADSTSEPQDTDRRVREVLADIAAFDADELDPDQSLMDGLGFDSLMLARLQRKLASVFQGVPELPLTRGMTVGNIMEFARLHSGQDSEESSEAASPDPVKPVTPSVPLTPVIVAPEFSSETRRAPLRGLEDTEGYRELQQRLKLIGDNTQTHPYFKTIEGVNQSVVTVAGSDLINYSSYNYIEMSGDPAVSQAAKDAIDHYGTSVSASRALSGQIPPHAELEAELADFLGVEDALAFVSGHATNVTTIGHLYGERDLILHDELAHNSIIQGAVLAGAQRLAFPHNDWAFVDRRLAALRERYDRVLIAIEGVYSMDGDIPDLAAFVELKERHDAELLVDEAHSLGTIGATGRGVAEYAGVDPRRVELWMGTMSKSLAGCGGYIAGSRKWVEYLRYTAPGFIFSVGMPAPNAAASKAALGVLRQEPGRVERLKARANLLRELVREQGLDTGPSADSPVVPVILGDSTRVMQVADALFQRGVNVEPITYPAVDQDAARLRFFVTSGHTQVQIRYTVDTLVRVLQERGELVCDAEERKSECSPAPSVSVS